MGSNDGGNYAGIIIGRNNSCSFYIYVTGAQTGIAGTSSNNCINPNDFQIGQELAGTSGANAPTADFVGTEFENSADQFQYQGADGSYSGNNPPWVGWVSGKKPSQTSNGGTLYTCTLPSSGKNPC